MRRYREISVGSFDKERASALAQKIKRTPHFAQLLLNRGIDTLAKYMKWSLVSPSNLHSPQLLPDIAKAVALLNETIERQQLIMICGDYDADGICATTILVRGLRRLIDPSLVTFWIPQRGDGYGFSLDEVETAVSLGVSLIVTVDCGSANSEAIAYAHTKGIKVIVTDHHHTDTNDPGAEAFVNPQRSDSNYPEKSICGAVVAWKVLEALYASRQLPQPQDLLDFAGFATITDMMPLHGENHILGRLGLNAIGRWNRPCLRALGDVSGVLARPIDAKAISFFMGPRLNAVGRVSNPVHGAELMLSDEVQKCRELALLVEDMNTERRRQQDQMVGEVEKRLDMKAARERGFILEWGPWNTGIVGIAAGMLMNKYRLTCLMGRLEGDIIKGSGRSPAGTSLHDALADCADVLEQFGGHAAAAGFAVRLDKVEEFSQRFAVALQKHQQPVPPKFVDFALDLKDIDLKFIAELRELEPTGMEAPSPCFLVRGVRFGNLREMKGGRYIGGTVSQDDMYKVKMVAFSAAQELRLHNLLSQKCDIVCSLDIDSFGGTNNPSLTIDYAVAADAQQLASLDNADGVLAAEDSYTDQDFQPVPPHAECPVAIALSAESQAAMLEHLRQMTAFGAAPRPAAAPPIAVAATTETKTETTTVEAAAMVTEVTTPATDPVTAPATVPEAAPELTGQALEVRAPSSRSKQPAEAHRLFARNDKELGELFPKIAAYLQDLKVPINREKLAVIVAFDTKGVPASVAERAAVITWKEWLEQSAQASWSDVFLVDPPLDWQYLRTSGLLQKVQRLYTFFNAPRWEAVQATLADWVVTSAQIQSAWERLAAVFAGAQGHCSARKIEELGALMQLTPQQTQMALTILREVKVLEWERSAAGYSLRALSTAKVGEWESSPLFQRLNRTWQNWQATRRALSGQPLTESMFWPS